jgi:RNA polymerase sigma-70 factor (ECF subfamily)
VSYLPAVNTSDDDTAIVARVLAGDVDAFEVLIRRHNRSVFRAARAILKSDDEAQDAMQEAYVSAFTHLRDFGGRARFSTWLIRIAVFEALGRKRRGNRTTSFDDADFAEEPMATTRSPENAASDAELRGVLEQAVDSLPVGFRAVFMLRSVEELTVEETADTLGIPAETVRTRHHRARALLRDSLAGTIESTAPRAFDFHLSRCDRVASYVLARIRQLT